MTISVPGRSQRRWRLVVYLAAIVAALAYMIAASSGEGPGFPLDDGWIHQTYARNLVQSGRLEFAPGAPSTGSTAPLWTFLIAIGHLLPVRPLWWSYALGILSLLVLVWAGMRLWRLLWPDYENGDWIAGMSLALSWPLLWAAGSGMESLLFVALGFLLMVLFMGHDMDAAGLGLLAGMLILTRPEGLILVILIGASLALKKQWRQLVRYLGASLLPLLPYFLFNLTVSGVLWPNTFYAKQTEYAVLLERPVYRRVLQLLVFSLGGPESGWRGISGAHFVLLPGLFVSSWQALRNDITHRKFWRTLPLLWAGGHVLAYALRLPVTYQHGRYLWAALPTWILFGLAGWIFLLAKLTRRGRFGRVFKRSTALIFFVLLFLFVVLGAQAYVQDVAFIQSEMVDVANWLRDHTEPDALVAAHDIGAIGYFAHRPILDLAGLISPQVIPLLDDEEALSRYVLRSDAAYLVTAPGWPYEAITSAADVQLVYQTNFVWTRQQGLNNMAVYALPAGESFTTRLPDGQPE